MPISRKSSRRIEETPLQPVERPAPRPAVGLPRRIVIFVVIRDESGSMSPWRQRQGEFIPQVAQHLKEVGGPRIGQLVYILYCVISGDVVATEFAPLDAAQDPAFSPDGCTPLGRGFAAVAEGLESFLNNQVFPQEVTPRNIELLVVSDLRPNGESAAETESGVAKLLDVVKKYRAAVNVVGPDAASMNHALAERLDVSGRGVKYLDSDPKAVLRITFDSLLSASRPAIGGPSRFSELG